MALLSSVESAPRAYRLKASNAASPISTSIGTMPWHIAGTGDFNGDGRPDILWRNDSGQVLTWDINDTRIVGGGGFGFVGTDWQIAGTGDFNGDGRPDVLWRNTRVRCVGET